MQNLSNTELQSTNSANPISLQSEEHRIPLSSTKLSKTSHNQHLQQPVNTMISRNGSFGSISSMSSMSSYHSSNTNQQNDEIFENVENEAPSTHNFPQRKHSDDTQHSNDDHPNEITEHNLIHTPSPKRESPVISPQINNNNHNTSLLLHEPPDLDTIEPSNIMLSNDDLSPHISALTKLHLNDNSLTNKTLTPSPNDPHNHYQATQLQHQDIKHPQCTNLDPQQTDLLSPRSRSSMSSITNALWSSVQTINHYLPYANNSNSVTNIHEDDPNLTDIDPNLTDTGDYECDDDEKQEDDLCRHRQSDPKQGHIQSNDTSNTTNSPLQPYSHSLQSIMNSPQFIDNAIAMYGQLDHALTNINNLKSQQLQQMQSLKQRRRKKRRQIYSNIQRDDDTVDTDNDRNIEPDEAHNDRDIEQEQIEHLDVNQHVVGVMKTLISSTTEMGSFFTATPSDPQSQLNDDNNDNQTPHSPTTSIVGQLLDKLSSSVAYMSYISVATITPYVYNVVEAILIELYSTIKDIIEYYDPDPKNNILWRIINKMNEIIEAIRGLLALSDCFYEISSDQDDDDQHESDYDDGNNKNHSYSFFMNNKKEKED